MRTAGLVVAMRPTSWEQRRQAEHVGLAGGQLHLVGEQGAELGDASRVPGGVPVAGVDRRREGLDGGAIGVADDRVEAVEVVPDVRQRLRRAKGDGAVATQALGQVHRLVGALQDGLRLVAVLRVAGDAGADGEPCGHAAALLAAGGAPAQAQALDRPAHLLGGLGGALLVGVGQQHHELLAAVPNRQVDRSDVAREQAGEGLQHLVADGVAVLVVDQLEAVEVEVDDRERLVGPLGPAELALQQVVEEAAVGQPGEVVVERLPLGALEEADHDVEQQGDGHGRRQEVQDGGERRGVERRQEGDLVLHHRHPPGPLRKPGVADLGGPPAGRELELAVALAGHCGELRRQRLHPQGGQELRPHSRHSPEAAPGCQRRPLPACGRGLAGGLGPL